MKFENMINLTLNMKFKHCVQCIDLYNHITFLLILVFNKYTVCLYFSYMYVPPCIPVYHYWYAVIMSIVLRTPSTPMVLILCGHRIKLITQSFHISLIVTRDSCEYYEVFIVRKHTKPMLRNWNWPNTNSKTCIFEMFIMNSIIISFSTSLFECMNTMVRLFSTSPYEYFNLKITYFLNVVPQVIFILYSVLEGVHIPEQIIRSIWYYFYINILCAHSPYYFLVYHINSDVYLIPYVTIITVTFMRNEVQIKHFEKTYKNLNLFKYDHEVYRSIAFIYSVFSYSLDYSDLDENNVNFTIRYKYPSIKRIRILLIYEKLHYSMQIYTTVFLIVYMYLYTVVQYSYTMLSDSMNIPHSEVITYINQYYLFTSLSIYYLTATLYISCYCEICIPTAKGAGME